MNKFSDNPAWLTESLGNFNDPVYEAGGFILEKNKQYGFVDVPNKHHGTQIGQALYEPAMEVFAKILNPYFKDGWKLFASFHTHPSFTAQYSNIDYENLFQNFPINYIKSIRYDQIIKYSWINEKDLKSERVR